MSRSVGSFPPLCLPTDLGIGRVPCQHFAEPIPFSHTDLPMQTSSEGRAIMRRSGLTLLELIVVLAILVALASVTVPLFTNRVSSSQLDSTYQSMLAIREAIMGQPGYFSDVKGLATSTVTPPYLTRTSIPTGLSASTIAIADSAGMPASLNDLYVNPGFTMSNGAAFDPLSRKGWRGPYLNQTMGNFNTTVVGGVTTTTVLDSFTPPSGSTTSNPILLEWPTGSTLGTVGSGGISASANLANYVRLRSFGANGQRFTALDTIWDQAFLTNAATTNAGSTTWGDDLILYIRRDVAGMDWTNYYNLKQSQ
jgi:prepilin-type N-terminal cleavage/methylation domain-containing protein